MTAILRLPCDLVTCLSPTPASLLRAALAGGRSGRAPSHGLSGERSQGLGIGSGWNQP